MVVVTLAGLCGPAAGCAGTRGKDLRVSVVEHREDRWATTLGETTVVVYARPRLRREVEQLFEHLSALQHQGLELRPGYELHFGWTTLTLTEQAGEYVFYEPDYDAADPEGASREDISASLDVLTAQHAVLMLAQRKAEAVDFDQHVLVSRGALERDRVYLVRVESPGARLTGWRIAPTDDDITDAEVDSMPVYEVYKRRPDLLSAMLLPAGFMAFFDDRGIDVIVDERDQPVWHRARPDEAAGEASDPGPDPGPA